MNILEISVSSAQFQADSWKSLLHINLSLAAYTKYYDPL